MAQGNGRNSHAQQYKALEKTLHEAFTYANQGRADTGYPKMAEEVEQTARGVNWVGPKQYKTAVWWSPAEFVDLLRARDAMGFTGGLLGFIRYLCMEACPHVAAAPRPTPRKKPIGPRSQKRNRHLRAAA